QWCPSRWRITATGAMLCACWCMKWDPSAAPRPRPRTVSVHWLQRTPWWTCPREPACQSALPCRCCDGTGEIAGAKRAVDRQKIEDRANQNLRRGNSVTVGLGWAWGVSVGAAAAGERLDCPRTLAFGSPNRLEGLSIESLSERGGFKTSPAAGRSAPGRCAVTG